MGNVFDFRTTGNKNLWAIYGTFEAGGTISRGDPVSITSSGSVAKATTGTEHRCIGVAAEDAVSGDGVQVLVYGFCDFITTDGNVADTDLILIADSTGVAVGATEAEVVSDPTLAFAMIGKNLGDDSGTTGYCFVCPGGVGTGDGV